ncbi:MAG: Smr/MutS family protein [Acidobacteria bacterium]|nr:Smr/MutS family protein [Acidobacteriota bacterium]
MTDQNPFQEPFQLELTDTLDLHSFRPDEIRKVTEIFLEEARAKGFQTVRIIHGKGIGVQREIVRNLLSKLEFIKRYSNGDEFSGGGSGATVVEFKDRETSGFNFD